MPRPDAKAKLAAAAPKPGPSKVILAAVIASVLIVGIVLAVIIGTRGSATPGDSTTPAGATGSTGGIVASTASLVSGAPTLDLYEDFQCPTCGAFEKQFGAEVDTVAKSGKAKVVYHMLSFLDVNLNNDSSTRSAIAGACAADQGKFLAYHDQVYAHQPAQEGVGYTDAQLAQFARDAGISGGAFTTWKVCVDTKKHAGYVAEVQKAATQAGVNSTPTVKLNGQDILTKLSSSSLTQLVQAATK